ncbi:hypothetical protein CHINAEXTREME_06340 [Halobiforma lacisalsi AJ5]|uniref:Uncharacterized protein n=1 Tax=Natronobacterium lacisalsi AJ5 TaxID=358396 RepID=M0LXH3_NATLA|nr:hypothetical protein [Halobiforma lacisalsi]APW97412.1 hypothetical protein CHINAEXTREME_06340 [Halobiforma lacisalsi AJ5]EMA38292.1 hypothetical protein C445_00285 [Halobiforma lacisalsi AJ5]
MTSDPDSDADSDVADGDDLELSEAEEQALHGMQLGIEYLYRAYGSLLEFHHHVGRAMNRMADAEDDLREAGHEEWADRLRDEHLPAGAIDDRWTFELVDEFSAEFLEEMDDFEASVREELADGLPHVSERRHKQHLRERADSDEYGGGEAERGAGRGTENDGEDGTEDDG